MARPRSVLLILFLLAGSLSPPGVAAQGVPGARNTSEEAPGFSLGENHPPTASPETWIPFNLEPSLFEGDRRAIVTMRIHNILMQVVAIPEATDHPAGRGTRLLNLEYTEPGRKIAYWDGKNLAGQLVQSGVYYVQLVVAGEGQPLAKQIIVDNPRRRRSGIFW